jgi:preprotein translocase subunit SecA
VQAQTPGGNRWAAEAKKQIDEGKIEEAGGCSSRSRTRPAAQQAAAEDDRGPGTRRAMDDAELALYQDPRKTELYALKEEAYFSIDEPRTNPT